MIDSYGYVRCDECGKKHAIKLEGEDYVYEWYCPKCHHFNREVSKGLDKQKTLVINSFIE